jgi:hypothetical protein
MALVSDISLSGIVTALACCVAIFLGGIAAVAALIPAAVSKPTPWESRPQRVMRYLGGPMITLGAGVICWGQGDEFAVLPLVGLLAGVVFYFIGARNDERRRNAWLTEGKEIEPP